MRDWVEEQVGLLRGVRSSLVTVKSCFTLSNGDSWAVPHFLKLVFEGGKSYLNRFVLFLRIQGLRGLKQGLSICVLLLAFHS